MCPAYIAAAAGGEREANGWGRLAGLRMQGGGRGLGLAPAEAACMVVGRGRVVEGRGWFELGSGLLVMGVDMLMSEG